MIPIKTRKLYEDITLPEYATVGSSGMDVRAYSYSYPNDMGTTHYLEANTPLFIQPQERVLIKTGLAFEIPRGYELQVRCRSGLALKQGLTLANAVGTIDSDYRGELGVIIFNTSSNPVEISKNDRVAQLILQKVEQALLVLDCDLSHTERNDGGYSSTGLK